MMGIYSIKNIINGKLYIGQSRDIDNRWFQHKNSLKNNTHRNIHLQNAYNKYGENAFAYNIIEVILDEKELNSKEKIYIKHCQTNNIKYGYNLTEGGEGYSINQEVKDKISISKRGNCSSLSIEEVRKIKMALYCLMDRKEICNMFNINEKVLTQIAIGKSFVYVCEELNDSIHNLKQKLIDERNQNILQLFKDGNTIAEIVKIVGLSASVVEKCVYKYTNTVDSKTLKYQNIYDEVFRLHDEGINNYQISKILKISPSTVQRYLTGENNPYKELPFKKVKNNIKDEIIDMYFNKNISSADIGKKYQISRASIMSFINNYKYANTEVI